jgi:predicted kinase
MFASAGGFPGSGKTHFSERFAKDINAVHLNSDRI